MDYKEIKQIVELMNKNELSYFHLEKDDFCLELKKGVDRESIQELLASAQPVLSAAPAPPPASTPVPPSLFGGGSDEELDLEGGEVIKAPMVGTFYRSSSPDAPPYAKVGQDVEEDTTVCIIEAMKTFNEIKAEQRGTIVKILVENAQPVQYDDPLFVIKPA